MLGACGPIPVNINGKTTYIGGNTTQTKNGKPAAKGSALKLTGKAINKNAGATINIPTDGLEPMYKTDVKVEGTVLRLNEHGFKKCGSAWGVGKPMGKIVVKNQQVLTVKFKENTPRSNPSYQGMMMLTPGDRYICKGHTSEGITMRFEPGEYYIYSAWSSAKTNNHKHPGEAFASTGQMEVYTLGRKTPAPVFTLDKSVPNPWFSKPFTYTGAYGKAKTAGFGKCSSYYPITATHVAEINVTEATEAVFNIRGAGRAILVNDKGSYWCDVNLNSPRKWQPGSYKVYATVGRKVAQSLDVTTFKAHHYNVKAAPTMQGDVPVYTIDELAKPKVIKGKTLGNRYTFAQGCSRYGKQRYYFSTQPDFYIKIDQPLAKLNLKMRSNGGLMLTVQDVTKNDQLLYAKERRCHSGGYRTSGDTSGYKLRKVDGKYAIWIAQKGKDPQDYTFILSSNKTKIDPYFTVKAIPADLPVEKRAVGTRFYPFMDTVRLGYNERTRVEAWERVDPKLIAFTTNATKVAEPKSSYSKRKNLGKRGAFTVQAGEPVIVLGVRERRKTGEAYKIDVMTSDLHVVTVMAKDLAGKKPEALVLPKKPRDYENFSAYTMTPHADKRAQSANTSYEKANKKYQTCFDKYWSKHEGSNASKFNRVTRRNGRIVKVKNMGKIIAERADRKCGYKGVESKRNKRDKELLRSFTKKRVELLKTIKARVQ